MGVIGIFRDVTEQKRAEEKITRRRAAARPVPGHAVARAAQSAGRDRDGDRLAEGRDPAPGDGRLLEVVDRQSRQMARLLDDLLEASRVTQNKIELRKTVIDLRVALEEACEVIGRRCSSASIELQLDISPDPIQVDGDPARLQQIHVNLLSNAAKYTPRGGHVWIRRSVEGDMAVVRVRDDGVGIPPDMLGAVFDLFVQSNRTLDRAAGGLGVGLTLVRSLVEMHGGIVEAHSDGEGKGSEFVVRLPLAAAASRRREPAPSPSRDTQHRRRCCRGARRRGRGQRGHARDALRAAHDAGFDCRPTAAARRPGRDPRVRAARRDAGRRPARDGRLRARAAHARRCRGAPT